MNDVDLNDALATIVATALRADAARAPDLPDEWEPVRVVLRPGGETTTRPRWRTAGIAAAAVVVFGSTLLVFRTRQSPPDSDTGTSWRPPGTEFPLTDLGPATTTQMGPTVAALTRRIGVPGQPDLVVSTTLAYSGGATAEVEYCLESSGGAGCRPEWSGLTWSSAVSSSKDNGVAAYDLFAVEGLPAAVAFVSYQDGDQLLWQRPVAGVVAFPDVTGANEVVIGYSTTGDQLGRFDPATQALHPSSAAPPLTADITQAEFNELSDLTRTELVSCLTKHGGTAANADDAVSAVVTFKKSVDQHRVWNTCVSTVNAKVAARVTEIQPRFFNSTEARPDNPDSPFHYPDRSKP